MNRRSTPFRQLSIVIRYKFEGIRPPVTHFAPWESHSL
jgi:hypothetical protein